MLPSGPLGGPAFCVGTPGFVEREDWRGDKDRAVRSRYDADQEGEGEVAQGRFAEDEEGRNRDEGEDRGVNGASHHLADGAVDHLVEAAPVVAHGRRVLPDPVEDDYGVVDGIAEHGKNGDDGDEADFPADDGVETYGHQYVVHERRHRGERERELEPKTDERDYDEQRGHHGLKGLIPQLLPEGRAHGRDADLSPGGLAEGVLAPALLLLSAYNRGPDLVAVLSQGRDYRVRGYLVRQRVANLLVA